MNKSNLKESLLNGFDFEKAEKIMTYLDWRWTVSNGVPNAEQLRRMASNLIDEILENERTTSISSGGLKVEKIWEYSNDEFDSLKLSFIALTSFSDIEI